MIFYCVTNTRNKCSLIVKCALNKIKNKLKDITEKSYWDYMKIKLCINKQGVIPRLVSRVKDN